MAKVPEMQNEKYESRLSPELLEKARVELNEIQSEVPGHIRALRARILQDPTMNFRTDNSFLLRFLRARKFNQDKAFQLMVNYYKQREYYPHFFNKTKSELERILVPKIFGVLPNRDSEGRAIILSLVERWDINEVPVEKLVIPSLLILEILVEDEALQINGVVWIINMSGYSLTHVAQMTPWKMKEAISVLSNTFPLRLKMNHLVNEPTIFDAIYLIIRQFLNMKIQDRVVFHGNCLASLHQYVSPEILPQELDGDLDPIDISEWNKLLLQNFDRITEDYKYGFVQQE